MSLDILTMGFGIRTPAKRTSAANGAESQRTTVEQAGPSRTSETNKNLNVRRSIGEWEASKAESQEKPAISKKEIDPQSTITKPKTMPPQGSIITERRLSTDAVGSSPAKYIDRLTEARACVVKAKTNLEKSRNTKTEIKTEVLQAINRLYQLVKEVDSIKGRGKPQTQTITQEEITVPPKEMELQKERMLKESELVKKMEEHARLIEDSNAKMEKLSETIEKHKEVQERLTYANVAAVQPKRQPYDQVALHSVVVSSKDENETGEEVLNRIREAVNAKDGGIKVDRVRKAKDRKVIVGCRSEEERQKVKERLRKAESHLNVEEVKNKDPLLILRDVLQYNTDEDVLNALRSQNGSMFTGLNKEDDRAEVRYRKRTRNTHTCHVILRVSPKMWNRMVEAGEVHIDLQRIKVADQTPLVQCSLCLGYGHGRRFCKETVEKCSHCGGPHMKADCADWLAGEAPSCCNCKHAKLDDQSHNAFSQECAVRRRWDALARATVAYC